MDAPRDALPERTSTAAVALFRRLDAGRIRYLTQWNLNWRALHFVGGHRRPDETYRECLVREIGEELGLVVDADYSLADEPAAHLEFEGFSDSAWALTAYTQEVFRGELSRPEALAKVDANPDNRWVTASEILAGRGQDGTRISSAAARILHELEPGGRLKARAVPGAEVATAVTRPSRSAGAAGWPRSRR